MCAIGVFKMWNFVAKNDCGNICWIVDLTSLEGAVGFSLPTEEHTPKWMDVTEEKNDDDDSELSKVRRRRLEHFSSTNLEEMAKEKEDETSAT